MTPQPSPEAVALVQAVIRAERECVVEEEQNGFTTPSHWALIGKLDATTEALFDKMVKDEEKAALFDAVEQNEWTLEFTAEFGRAAWRIRTGFSVALRPIYAFGRTPAEAIRAAIDAARTPSEVSA